MAVLVADGADAGELVARRPRVFRVEREIRDLHAVEQQAQVGDVPRLGPERIVAAALGFVVSGEEEEDVVHHPVTVEVVAREIHPGRIGRRTGMRHQLLDVLVGDAVLVGAVPGHGIGQRHHVADLEAEAAAVPQVVAEPVEHAARGPVVRIILLVEQVVDGAARRGNGELPVLELHRNHDGPDVDLGFGGQEEGQRAAFGVELLLEQGCGGRQGVGLVPPALRILENGTSVDRGFP